MSVSGPSIAGSPNPLVTFLNTVKQNFETVDNQQKDGTLDHQELTQAFQGMFGADASFANTFGLSESVNDANTFVDVFMMGSIDPQLKSWFGLSMKDLDRAINTLSSGESAENYMQNLMNEQQDRLGGKDYFSFVESSQSRALSNLQGMSERLLPTESESLAYYQNLHAQSQGAAAPGQPQ